tara:strand:- start:117 stop:1607 length:1491 start_codon:yes stop_codon:yes gene_type:complete
MRKTNFFSKFFKNISHLINSLLEKNLNKLNFKNLSYLFKNNKIILTFVAFFVIFISYLLLPTFYSQSDISKELKIELQKKFDVNFEFSAKIRYNFFPRPHFIITSSTIFDKKKEISKINKLTIFVSLDNLFSFKNINIKDLIFEDANFNLSKENHNFFIQLLSKNFKDGNLTIKNSNIFFKNSEHEVLFINKIKNMKYYYDPKELKNIFVSDNEIFNIPYSIKSYFNGKKSKIFSQIDLNLMKFKIENELTINDEKKIGKADFVLNKKKYGAGYEIKKKYFEFHIYDRKEQPSIRYKGKFNLKPFYANLEGDLEEINFVNLFGSNAIIADLLKTEIFNSKNIDFKLEINANYLHKNFQFQNINFRAKIQEGLIDTDNTKFKWKNFAEFEVLESLIFVKNGELILDGKLKININDSDEIYKFLLTPKNYRNKIKQIDLNFTYNFDQNIAELKHIKIDNIINKDVSKILNNLILKKNNLKNKIYFKNLLNEALKNYAG